MKKYLEATELLDYEHPEIQKIIAKRAWKDLPIKERVTQIYDFVRDEILFGYNESDNIPSSRVLKDGYGQCNTKSGLLMALLRGAGIPNRIHGFTIDKELQKGAISGIWYKLSPKRILHTWVEVLVDDNWYYLEGVILDKPYLAALQKKFSDCKTTFCGYGAYTDNFENPEIEWNYNHTFIQDKGIKDDFGLFDNPDLFYQVHGQELSRLKRLLFRKLVRHRMNRNVRRIRKGSH